MPSKTSPLDQLRAAGTVLIADTADFEKIAKFKPSEGTTNPSLLYAAAQDPAYAHLLDNTIKYAKSLPASKDRLLLAVDYLAVQFGSQIHGLTGRISTEVDASLSFDTKSTVAGALRILELYKEAGVPKEDVRIKISATWEGIQAARILQNEHGVSCLITVVFSLIQAITAAEAGADAIAPYVGRIADWGKTHGHVGDLGVETVQKIQDYLRKHGHDTKVMAASFRSVDQIRNLAGIDLLTAAPTILEKVEADEREIVPVLTAESAQKNGVEKASYINDEAAFRWALNGDACAVEKSAEAMRKFGEDTDKLKELLASML